MSETAPVPSGPSGSVPRIPRPRSPLRDPVLYDWAVEIPEWRRCPPSASSVDRLPELVMGPPPGGPGVAAAAASALEAARRARMRLTVRGRVVVVSLLCAVATGALSMLFVNSAVAGSSASDAPVGSFFGGGVAPTVTVEDGDTLWAIADRLRPEDDTRRTVHEIVELNELVDPSVVPGQELRIPAF